MLKPGGCLRFIEHVRAEGFPGTLLDLATPIWRRLAAGCRPNRRTTYAIQEAGFSLENVEQRRLPGGLPLVAGTARAS